LEGALGALLPDGWAVTGAGLEKEGHGVVLPQHRFPDPAGQMMRGEGLVKFGVLFEPERPEWVEPESWAAAVGAGTMYLPLERYEGEVTEYWRQSSEPPA
jgi:hypothetical protein